MTDKEFERGKSTYYKCLYMYQGRTAKLTPMKAIIIGHWIKECQLRNGKIYPGSWYEHGRAKFKQSISKWPHVAVTLKLMGLNL